MSTTNSHCRKKLPHKTWKDLGSQCHVCPPFFLTAHVVRSPRIAVIARGLGSPPPGSRKQQTHLYYQHYNTWKSQKNLERRKLMLRHRISFFLCLLQNLLLALTLGSRQAGKFLNLSHSLSKVAFCIRHLRCSRDHNGFAHKIVMSHGSVHSASNVVFMTLFPAFLTSASL